MSRKTVGKERAAHGERTGEDERAVSSEETVSHERAEIGEKPAKSARAVPTARSGRPVRL
jgi:hypothetical protein